MSTQVLLPHVGELPRQVAFLLDVSLSRRNQALLCLSAPLGHVVALHRAFRIDVSVSRRNYLSPQVLLPHVAEVPRRVAFLMDVSLSRRHLALLCLFAPLGNGVARHRARVGDRGRTDRGPGEDRGRKIESLDIAIYRGVQQVSVRSDRGRKPTCNHLGAHSLRRPSYPVSVGPVVIDYWCRSGSECHLA